MKVGLEAAVDKLSRENHSIESGKKPLVHSDVKHFLSLLLVSYKYNEKEGNMFFTRNY